MALFERNTLLTDLRNGVIEVTFEKDNGQTRVLRCTLLMALMPQKYQEKLEEQTNEQTYHQQNQDTIRAWDVDNKGWRSFKIEAIKYVQSLDPMLFK
jgi:hypothetical protein